MTTKREVDNFLTEFKEKMKIWDVLFRADRDCNIQALADLGIRPTDRKKILENLKDDFVQGKQTFFLSEGRIHNCLSFLQMCRHRRIIHYN